MKNFKRLSVMLFALAMGSLLTISCKKDEEVKPMDPKVGTIVEVASGNPDFSILVAAVKRAGLVDVLSSTGPFTVFAPTNKAFESLLTELGVSKLEDIPVETLKAVLLYHVISAKVPSSAVATGYVPTNAEGPNGSKVSLYIVKDSKGVKIDNRANVTAVDIAASNGVIHVIDKVLLPNKIVQMAINDPSFSTLVAAVVYADLVGALNADGPFTVFAPTNDAFAALLDAAGATKLEDLSKETVAAVLLDHVVAGNVNSKDLANGNVPTLGGNDITVSGVGSTPKLNGDINITAVDIQGTNGVFHRIDKVIFN
ncbi:MAG TPA: fasciclin domain-containing protein [Chitinophagales bacterium]|nr:fasciclin domain-containing protein [Chitinophagales bacterium]